MGKLAQLAKTAALDHHHEAFEPFVFIEFGLPRGCDVVATFASEQRSVQLDDFRRWSKGYDLFG